MSLTEGESGSAAGVGDAELDQILNELLPGGVTDELRVAFKSDAKLMIAVKQIAAIRALEQQITDAKAVVAKPKPDQWIGGWGPGNAIGRTENPAYKPAQDERAKADALLKQYYSDWEYKEPTPALKAKITEASQATTAARNQAGVIQNKAQTPDKAPTVIDLPTGKPGETQDSVWDPSLNDGKGGYRPILGPDGKPVPPKQGTPPQTPNPRVDEGTQSWELKELDGVWYQVPIRARKDGSWEPDTSRQPVKAQGMPGPGVKLEMIDGVPHTYDPGTKTLQPIPGYVKPPQFRTDAQGRGYTSADGGKTWQPASGLPGTPQTVTVDGTVYPLDENGLPIVDRGVKVPRGSAPQTVDGYLVEVDPVTKQVTRTDLYTPEQRARLDEVAGLNVDTARANLARSAALQDPVAEYQRQVGLLQTTATQQRDALNDKVLRGELSVEDASTQFDSWWETNVEAKLSPYQTMAEGAYRKEQNEYLQKQAAEQARVDAINRQREQLGYQAGEQARAGLNALAPQARSPEFLAQLAQNVSNIGKPLPGGPSQHSGGMQFSPESLSLANVRRAMPDLAQVGRDAAARALAQISPAAAQSVGAPPPAPPSFPDFASYMAKAPFQIPNPSLAVPGMGAIDLGNPAGAAQLGLPVQPGYAGTMYQGGKISPPWLIGG